MRDKFLHSKYVKVHTHQSFSICHRIKHFYDVIEENTFWTVGQGDRINLWNDLWCSSKYISFLTGKTPQERITLTSNVADGWNDSWNLSLNLLQHNQIQTLHQLTIIDLLDIKIGNLRIVLFLIRWQPKISSLPIWYNSILPGKTLVFSKVLRRHFPTDLDAKKRGVSLCSMYPLCGCKLRILIIYFLIALLFHLYGPDLKIFFLILLTYLLLVLLLY